MINIKQGIWLSGVLGLIIVILLCILFFVPSPEEKLVGADGLQINLKQNQEVSSPLTITGVVTGKDSWAGFEGQVGNVKLLDTTGNELSVGVLTATTEWTTLPTSFETTLNFQADGATSGVLVFHNENPSGIPEKNKTFTLPIKIGKSSGELMTVKVYFGGSILADAECDVVSPVDRIIPKTQTVARATIEELLKGPTVEEKVGGYLSVIPVGSKLNSISIVNGEARVDFSATTESGGGSCSMAARVAQITQTLLQFPTITSVKLSINGRTGDIFQP
ncbi:MAG: GerMN domain-containing protein [Candidatus Staskawiczbacteria bacterium]|nr:GerMN domain-containing protein [Candidatus Staskawiczbacteria bacterium]